MRERRDALLVAQEELAARAVAAFDVGDWQQGQLAERMTEVADHLRRVALPTASPYYRAEKSSVLLSCAVALHRLVMESYAGWPDEDSGAGQALADAAKVLVATSEAAVRVMWATNPADRAAGTPVVDAATAHEARQAARAALEWAEGLTARGVGPGR